jgi:hypothetical protein
MIFVNNINWIEGVSKCLSPWALPREAPGVKLWPWKFKSRPNRTSRPSCLWSAWKAMRVLVGRWDAEQHTTEIEKSASSRKASFATFIAMPTEIFGQCA